MNRNEGLRWLASELAWERRLGQLRAGQSPATDAAEAEVERRQPAPLAA